MNCNNKDCDSGEAKGFMYGTVLALFISMGVLLTHMIILRSVSSPDWKCTTYSIEKQECVKYEKADRHD